MSYNIEEFGKFCVGSGGADKSFDIFVFVSYAQRFFPVSLGPAEGVEAHRSHKRTDGTANLGNAKSTIRGYRVPAPSL